MLFIPKPVNRESILRFGDGDIAIFGHTSLSSRQGYRIFHFKPLETMRWKKQIQISEYDKYDGWIKKTYRADLCFQISENPDFASWDILCDYYGNENTPMLNEYINLRLMILRNRALEKEIEQLRIENAKIRRDSRQRVIHPEEYWLETMDKLKMLKDTAGHSQPPPPENYPPQPQQQ